MTYTNPTPVPSGPVMTETTVVDYHDRVRWGPIFAGIVISISAQLMLSALGAAIGFTAGATGSEAGAVSLGIGIWSIISLLISLFIGGWIMATTCGPMSRKTAMLNGTILWGTTLAVSAWLLASGVSGTFGIIAANAGDVINQVQEPGGAAIPNPNSIPNVSPTEAQNYAATAAKTGWSFLLGALLGLASSIFGASVGTRKVKYRP